MSFAGKGVPVETRFARMVDELVVLAEDDRELAEGLRWLDRRARERRVSFYDAVFDVLYGRG